MGDLHTGGYPPAVEKVVREGGMVPPPPSRTPIFDLPLTIEGSPPVRGSLKNIYRVKLCVDLISGIRIVFKQFISEKKIIKFSDFSIFTNVCKRERESETFWFPEKSSHIFLPKLNTHTENQLLRRPPRVFTMPISRKTNLQLEIFYSVLLGVFLFPVENCGT